MSYEQRTNDMIKMSASIADLADAQAPNFKDVPGDMALRMFAESIRKTNMQMSEIRRPQGN